jgi:hypothetical protein
MNEILLLPPFSLLLNLLVVLNYTKSGNIVVVVEVHNKNHKIDDVAGRKEKIMQIANHY